MVEIAIGGRVHRIERLRLGEIKAISRITAHPVDPDPAALVDRCAQIVAAATARFGAEAFLADDETECSAAELNAAAQAVLVLGGFVSAPGEAPAAAG